MKKTQKKLGNKGFSLVELIVVIAIMAVLVGVLAPTLIRNVEKSRESTDLQNLDSIRQSVVTAVSTEAVAKELDTTNGNVVAYSDITASSTNNLAKALYEEMNEDGTLSVAMKSAAASKSGNTIQIKITANGKVSVGVYSEAPTTTTAGTVVNCARTKSTSFISE